MRNRLRVTRAALTVGVVGVLAAGCTLFGGAEEPAGGDVVTLATHDSWTVPQQVLDAFTERTGIEIEVLKQGDAGALTNKLVLTKANPIADVTYGIDSTFASRALSEGVFTPYQSPLAQQGPQRYAIGDGLSAVDLGDVCVNIDTTWFAEHGIKEPAGYADLADPRYRDLLVVPSPATSSPGLAFLLGTIAEYGEQGWQDYWSKLEANGAEAVSGWTEAYSQRFSGSSGNGPKPIVVSYASSPAAEVGEDGKPRTKALLDTCYRQVEYAGVLAGTDAPEAARKVIDFLLSEQFQSIVSENMYVYPTREGTALPPGWAGAAPLPEDPAQLPSEQVAQHRKGWIEQWRALFNG